MTKPRRFGRAGHAGFGKKAVDWGLGVLYHGGWPAFVTHAMGLQGTLRVSEHTFAIPRLRANARPLRVAFASDFHAGPTVHPRLMASVFAALESFAPDLYLFGGDHVSFHATNIDSIIGPLARLRAPLGKFAVLGNHDLMADDEYIVRRLGDAGVQVLINANARLGSPHDDVWVCGLDDWDEGHPDSERTLAGAEGTRILLAHQPDGLTVLGWDPLESTCRHASLSIL